MPRSSVSLVLRFRVRVSLLHLRTIAPRHRRRRSEMTIAGQCLYARILHSKIHLLILILISNNNSDFRFREFRLWNGVQTLQTRDTSDPRHFGTIEIGPKCPDSSALVPKCPYDTSAPVQLGHFLVCDLSKNEQSYALQKCDRPPKDESSDHRMTSRHSKPFTAL